mmetsp:Transcript_18016/g.50190  ORF Transcript_18016/g.50190 Transcript_18016/m.50190 type:complete len:202 (-) Transcript_18016:531-1136(-)|eukprot:scaffold49383_cov27-Tisochrysis_lutea.AAC.8
MERLLRHLLCEPLTAEDDLKMQPQRLHPYPQLEDVRGGREFAPNGLHFLTEGANVARIEHVDDGHLRFIEALHHGASRALLKQDRPTIFEVTEDKNAVRPLLEDKRKTRLELQFALCRCCDLMHILLLGEQIGGHDVGEPEGARRHVKVLARRVHQHRPVPRAHTRMKQQPEDWQCGDKLLNRLLHAREGLVAAHRLGHAL